MRRIQITNVPDFWPRLCASKSSLLALDYDGTLAPFHIDPMAAYPLPGISNALKAVGRSRNTTVGIISGRPVNEVLALLGELGITIIGSHGFECMRPDGNVAVKSPGPKQLMGLEKAEEMGRLALGGRIETKVASVALHTRGMPPEEAARIESRAFHEWGLLALFYELECRRFNGGIELRATGRHKGNAFLDLLGEMPEQTFAVYIGDDETDEDAFRVVQRYGVGIKVGEPIGATAAMGFLPDCQAVKTFIETWWMSIKALERS